MFAHIRRHQKWLWIVISSLVIISFVWYFNPNQQGGMAGSGGRDGIVGSIDGEPITQREYENAWREATLHYLFQYGQWPDQSEAMRQMRPVEREARSRIFLIRKLKDLNIQVSDEAVAEWIATAFQDRETKTFNKDVYDRFTSQLPQRGLKAADFERYARHQAGITHLAALAGAPGKFITPQEAEEVYRHQNEKADTKLVHINASNYLARVEVTPEAVGTFYTNRAAFYRLPERVQLSYVPFFASNYLAKVDEQLNADTNLSQQIDAFYLQRGPSFYTDASGQPLPPETAKARIREEVRKDRALVEARKDAIAFATALEEVVENSEGKANPSNPAEPLEKLAAHRGLEVRVTEAFSQNEGPVSLGVPDQLARIAFSLTPEEPIITEPVVGEEGVFVFALKNRVPSEVPALETLQARVTEDFRRAEALRMTREAGQTFANVVTNGLAAGKTLEQIAQEAGFTVVDLPPITREGRTPILNLPPQLDSSLIRATAFETPAGSATGFRSARDGGFVLFVEQFVPASDAEVQEGLAKFTQELQRQRAGEAFSDWFSKEMQMANLVLNDGLDEQNF